jgi:hypothetical protein
MVENTKELLTLRTPQELEEWCLAFAPEASEAFEKLVPLALLGDQAALTSYVSVWMGTTEALLGDLRGVAPDLVVPFGDHLVLVDVKHSPSPASRELLAEAAVSAPFSTWVTRSGVGVGTCAFLAGQVLEMLPSLNAPTLDETAIPAWDLDATGVRIFMNRVRDAIKGTAPPLQTVRDVFALNLTELGALFGVKRQAVTSWLKEDVPSERRPKVSTVASIARFLDRKLRTGAPAAVVRRPVDAYGGLTTLEMIRADRHEQVLDSIQSAFDWSTTD